MNGRHAREHGQCLTDETLADYLDSGLDPLVRAACDEHLIGCDQCRENLALLMRVLRPDEDPQEQAEIQVITAIYERKSRLPIPPRNARQRRWLVPAVGIAAALCIVGLLFFRASPEPPKSRDEVVRLLLLEKRPFEATLTDQPYRPISQTRGPQDLGVNYGLVKEGMADMAEDSYQDGRFYLIQKEFKLAITKLEEAERQAPLSPRILNDLGVAYLEDGNKDDASKAVEKFNMALKADPRFAPAVFNLALYHNKNSDTRLAEKYWQFYLDLDPDSGWAKEVRSNLEGAGR